MPAIMSRQYVVADNFYKHTLLPTLSLFTSVGTLVCCALPALFVTLLALVGCDDPLRSAAFSTVQITPQTITFPSLMEGESAVVILETGNVKAPIACLMEKGEWKVTIRGTLECMQKQVQDLMASAPR